MNTSNLLSCKDADSRAAKEKTAAISLQSCRPGRLDATQTHPARNRTEWSNIKLRRCAASRFKLYSLGTATASYWRFPPLDMFQTYIRREPNETWQMVMARPPPSRRPDLCLIFASFAASLISRVAGPPSQSRTFATRTPFVSLSARGLLGGWLTQGLPHTCIL